MVSKALKYKICGRLLPWGPFQRFFQSRDPEYVQRFLDNQLVNSPLKLEHQSLPRGTITRAYVKPEDGVWIEAVLFGAHQCPENQPVIDKLCSGELRELSIKADIYNVDGDNRLVIANEASIVREGGFQGTRIASVTQMEMSQESSGIVQTFFFTDAGRVSVERVVSAGGENVYKGDGAPGSYPGRAGVRVALSLTLPFVFRACCSLTPPCRRRTSSSS